MIVDYRIYLTLYALAVVAWMATIPLMSVMGFRFTNRWMVGVGGSAMVVALFNYLDWLWS